MSKTRARHKKESLSLSLPPPRNPLVAQALMRRAGSHRKSSKTLRQGAARQLKQILKEE